jgi:hypothetical protein
VSAYDRSNHEVALAVAVSPDGSKVFVTGESAQDYATVAMDAGTGAVLWTARYDGPGHGQDVGVAIRVSPDGLRVFVTGSSDNSRVVRYLDYATIAYEADTGHALWLRRYDGGDDDVPVARGESRRVDRGGDGNVGHQHRHDRLRSRKRRHALVGQLQRAGGWIRLCRGSRIRSSRDRGLRHRVE